jgi:hypothetical protein
MKTFNFSKLLLLFLFIGGLFSCELRNDDPVPILKSDQALEGMVIIDAGNDGYEMPAELCGDPVIVPLFEYGLGDPSFGNVMVGNDEEYLYVKIEVTEECWKIHKVFLYVGEYDAIPLADPGSPPSYPAFWNNAFDQLVFDPLAGSYTNRYLLAGLPECPAILAKVIVKCDGKDKILWAMGTNPGWDQKAYYFEYCVEDCNGCKPGIYRTQTPGGWGAKPAGNNPGEYLSTHFAGAFPDGLEVGGPITITLTSASSITDLLPTGGKPGVLDKTEVDPLKIKNVLVGHVVALTLSMRFDELDPDFGEADGWLGDLVIDNGGAFDGWRVADILAEANKVLGGATSSFTPSDMTDILALINEYFVDGKLSADYKLFRCISVD